MGGVGMGVTLGPTLGALAFVPTSVGRALPFLLVAAVVGLVFLFALLCTGGGDDETRPCAGSINRPLNVSVRRDGSDNSSVNVAAEDPPVVTRTPRMLALLADSMVVSLLVSLAAANSVIAALEPTIPLWLTGIFKPLVHILYSTYRTHRT